MNYSKSITLNDKLSNFPHSWAALAIVVSLLELGGVISDPKMRLTTKLGVSRNTIYKAIEELETRGVIELGTRSKKNQPVTIQFSAKWRGND